MRQPAISQALRTEYRRKGRVLDIGPPRLANPQPLCGAVTSCWLALWPGNSRSANLAVFLVPPSASCAC